MQTTDNQPKVEEWEPRNIDFNTVATPIYMDQLDQMDWANHLKEAELEEKQRNDQLRANAQKTPKQDPEKVPGDQRRSETPLPTEQRRYTDLDRRRTRTSDVIPERTRSRTDEDPVVRAAEILIRNTDR